MPFLEGFSSIRIPFKTSLEIKEKSFVHGFFIFGRIFLYMNSFSHSLEIEENSIIPGFLISGKIFLYMNPF